MKNTTKIIEELTDIIAIIALATMVILNSEPSTAIVGAITSIAVGRRVIKK